MKLENQNLIKEFHQRMQSKYPHMSFDETKMIVMSPFMFVRQEIESGRMRTIRLKYFGTFLVYPKRAAFILSRLSEQFKELKVDTKYYFKQKVLIEKFLEHENQEKNK